MNPQDLPGLAGKSEDAVRAAVSECQATVYTSPRMAMLYFEVIAVSCAVVVAVGSLADWSRPWIGASLAVLLAVYFRRVRNFWARQVRRELQLRYGAAPEAAR